LIDFRYHLVSIIAVFLALAVGIAVGAEAVSPDLASTFKKELQSANKSNAQLYAANNTLKRQIRADQAFAQAASSTLLPHLLTGERVVLVTAPGADNATVTGIRSALNQAGATITGTISLAPQFFDVNSTTEAELNATAIAVSAPDVNSSGTAGNQIAGQQAAAKVLAKALMDPSGVSTLPSDQINKVMAGFGQGGFLQVSNGGGTTLSSQATLAVVVIPATTPANPSSISPENLALIYFTHYLQQYGKGAVLAGSLQGSGAGSAIDAVTSGGADVSVTTVDNADSATGQIIVAQALRDLLDGHPVSAYGVGPDAAPSPAPTPVPTSTPPPSKTPKRKVKR
jgi:hypothetical protein